MAEIKKLLTVSTDSLSSVNELGAATISKINTIDYPSLNSGLSLHYKLTEDSSPLATDSAGSNDGTLSNGARWGDGVIFDGSNDIIDAESALASMFQAEFSICFWFRLDDGVDSTKRGFCGVKDSAFDNQVYVAIQNGSLYARYSADGNDSTEWTAASVIANGPTSWHHFCLTVESAGIIGYLDGSVVGTTASMSGVTMADYTAGTFNFHVGGGNYFLTFEYFTDGAMKDFRIYPRVLTAGNASTLYSWGRPASVVSATTFDSNYKDATVTLSNSDMTAANSLATGNVGVRAKGGRNSGKYYFEMSVDTLTGSKQERIGISKELATPYTGSSGTNPSLDMSNGVLRHDGSYSNTDCPTIVLGDIIGVAVDLDNGELYMSRNNTWISLTGESSDPATGTDPIYDLLTDYFNYFPAVAWYYDADTVSLAVESGTLNYTPPSGYSAWGD